MCYAITFKLKANIDQSLDVDYDAMAKVLRTKASALRKAMAEHCYFKTDESENDRNDGNGDSDPNGEVVETDVAAGLLLGFNDELRIRNMNVDLVLEAMTLVENTIATTNTMTTTQPPSTELNVAVATTTTVMTTAQLPSTEEAAQSSTCEAVETSVRNMNVDIVLEAMTLVENTIATTNIMTTTQPPSTEVNVVVATTTTIMTTAQLPSMEEEAHSATCEAVETSVTLTTTPAVVTTFPSSEPSAVNTTTLGNSPSKQSVIAAPAAITTIASSKPSTVNTTSPHSPLKRLNYMNVENRIRTPTPDRNKLYFEKSMSPKQLLIVMKSPAISNTTTKITLFPYKKKTKVSQNVEFNIVYETR